MEYNSDKNPTEIFDSYAGVNLGSGENIGGRVLCWAPIDYLEILIRNG